MRTILIADEDRAARTALRRIIRRSSVPVETILECGTAARLLELLERYQVDALFTEVQLPDMACGTMLEAIAGLHRPTKLVAVTGRADFADSVRLFRAGAVNYLLKPAAAEQVEEVLRRLAEEQRLQESARRLALRSSARYLTWYLWGDGSELQEEEREQFIADNEALFFDGPYRVCVIGGEEDLRTEQQLITLRRANAQRVLIMEEQDLQPFLVNAGEAVCPGVSAPHTGLEELKTACAEAQEMRRIAFCLNRTVRFGEDALPQVPEALRTADAKLLEEAARMKRIQTIGTGREQEALRHWVHLFEAAHALHVQPEDFARTLRGDLEQLRAVYGGRLTEAQLQALERMRAVFGCASLQALEEALLALLRDLCAQLGAAEGSPDGDGKMQKAVAYIREHYASDLNMAMVSNYISMNYSLFSLAFKEYTGTNFVNYLRDLRIKKACALLEETDLKILEVSAAVGYENEKHFMRLFKAVCGVSPSEYRRNSQKGKQQAE